MSSTVGTVRAVFEFMRLFVHCGVNRCVELEISLALRAACGVVSKGQILR